MRFGAACGKGGGGEIIMLRGERQREIPVKVQTLLGITGQ